MKPILKDILDCLLYLLCWAGTFLLLAALVIGPLIVAVYVVVTTLRLMGVIG